SAGSRMTLVHARDCWSTRTAERRTCGTACCVPSAIRLSASLRTLSGCCARFDSRRASASSWTPPPSRPCGATPLRPSPSLASAFAMRSCASWGRARHLVRHHMFAYAPPWSDAAVRRFIRRVGASSLADLFALRRADDVASGVEEPQRGGLDELRARVGRELASSPLTAGQLVVRG